MTTLSNKFVKQLQHTWYTKLIKTSDKNINTLVLIVTSDKPIIMILNIFHNIFYKTKLQVSNIIIIIHIYLYN